jgi:SAM-dependent methyltransferase
LFSTKHQNKQALNPVQNISNMKTFWDQRYKESAYAFGKDPNEYFKSVLTGLKPGKILLPAEGEGRNAVFAASLGWEVFAFDISEEGKRKAEHLAAEKQVRVDYAIAEMKDVQYLPDFFDAIALVFAHFDESLRSAYHKQLGRFLKTGGHLILEGFNKNHLHYNTENPAVGGPRDLSMLYAAADLQQDFEGFEIRELVEQETTLNEGAYHAGKGAVVRFWGIKN